jgi:hypothetical protein
MSRKREVYQRTLNDLISEEVFKPRGTGETPEESTLSYRIPAHQRFPSWSLPKKQRLVESVLKDYPIHAFIMIRQNMDYSFVEDGQTRMTSLHEFIMDAFPCETGTIGAGKKFSELPSKMQQAFLNYQVTIESFNATSTSADEMADIFERLNSGKPLSDNDKFHARLNTPVLAFALEIKDHPELRVDFTHFIGPIGTGKTRKLLGDIVGTINALSFDGCACINTSYELNYKYLSNEIDSAQKDNIFQFFKAYFKMLHDSLDTFDAKPKKRFGKLSGPLGLSVCSWVNEQAIIACIPWYVVKVSKNSKYEPKTFKLLSSGDKRNCQGNAIKRRLDAINLQLTKEMDEQQEHQELDSIDDISSDEQEEDSDTD